MQGCLSIIDFLDKHSSLCIVLSSIISVFISAGFSVLIAWSLRRSEELRARSQIAVQIGVEANKRNIELGKLITQQGGKATFFPIEMWILSSMKLAELLMIKNLNTKTAKIKLQEAINFSREISKTIDQK